MSVLKRASESYKFLIHLIPRYYDFLDWFDIVVRDLTVDSYFWFASREKQSKRSSNAFTMYATINFGTLPKARKENVADVKYF